MAGKLDRKNLVKNDCRSIKVKAHVSCWFLYQLLLQTQKKYFNYVMFFGGKMDSLHVSFFCIFFLI